MINNDLILYADFAAEHGESNYCNLYVIALKILNEEAKDQWTSQDVIETVLRAAKKLDY